MKISIQFKTVLLRVDVRFAHKVQYSLVQPNVLIALLAHILHILDPGARNAHSVLQLIAAPQWQWHIQYPVHLGHIHM